MPDQILPLSFAQLGLNSGPVMSVHRTVRCWIVCLFVPSVWALAVPQLFVCLFGQIVCPHPYLLAVCLFVCSLRRGLSRPSLFVCLFQGCSRPLISILALVRSGRHTGLLLSCYSASMVLSTRKFAPQIMHLPH